MPQIPCWYSNTNMEFTAIIFLDICHVYLDRGWSSFWLAAFVSIKNLQSATHLRYLRNQDLPALSGEGLSIDTSSADSFLQAPASSSPASLGRRPLSKALSVHRPPLRSDSVLLLFLCSRFLPTVVRQAWCVGSYSWSFFSDQQVAEPRGNHYRRQDKRIQITIDLF